jgi:putative hydrolase of HD superfamily
MALKSLYRQGWLKRDVPELRCESVADHSFGTALLALLLAGREPFADVDRDRAIRMALIHELCEVYAGDITPVDGISAEEKHRLERDSLLRVLAGLPGSLTDQTADGPGPDGPGKGDGAELLALWDDFEAGASPEARLIRQLDRLEMGIQAAIYRAEGYGRMHEFLDSAEKALEDGSLKAILMEMLG